MNIYKDGEWGTITTNIVEDSSFNVILDKNSTTHINAVT